MTNPGDSVIVPSIRVQAMKRTSSREQKRTESSRRMRGARRTFGEYLLEPRTERTGKDGFEEGETFAGFPSAVGCGVVTDVITVRVSGPGKLQGTDTPAEAAAVRRL